MSLNHESTSFDNLTVEPDRIFLTEGDAAFLVCETGATVRDSVSLACVNKYRKHSVHELLG